MADLIENNTDKPAAGFVSHADDFMISCIHADAIATWRKKTVTALKDIGLKTHEAKSRSSENGELNGNTRRSSPRRTL